MYWFILYTSMYHASNEHKAHIDKQMSSALLYSQIMAYFYDTCIKQ